MTDSANTSTTINSAPRVHWLGTGLSSAPGIVRLASNNIALTLWYRTKSSADAIIKQVNNTACLPNSAKLDWDVLAQQVNRGDVVVSMLPGTFHVQAAKICLEKAAHFVSSSYLSPDMQQLDSDAMLQGLSFVNEVGLDPGIDHLLAHKLISEYKNSSCFNENNQIRFRSHCGGFPATPNDFRYKFSWSPAGVLKALKSQAKWICDGKTQTQAHPWKSITTEQIQLGNNRSEQFEAYPNRDSLPYVPHYNIPHNWNVHEFVRGTLRLDGWSKAWSSLFNTIESLEGPDGDSTIKAISDDLWQKYAYSPNEPDRVVLQVELAVNTVSNETVFHKSMVIDSIGNQSASAMARLVSNTVSMAVEDVLGGHCEPGVQGAPSASDTVDRWLNQTSENGDPVLTIDHTEIVASTRLSA